MKGMKGNRMDLKTLQKCGRKGTMDEHGLVQDLWF